MRQVRVYSSLAETPRREYLVTIGTFDGVHLGHQYLLKRATARARELAIPSLVITFEPLPSQVLRPTTFEGRLTTADAKVDLVGALGSENVLVLPFSAEFACTTAEEFLRDLVATFGVKELWVGEEFALGKDRRGTIDRLGEIARDLGFSVAALPRVQLGDEIVSSSRVRKLIQAGDVSSANELLGRRFRIGGEVREGAKIGRTIGFPTANVLPPHDLVQLADGIYASMARTSSSGPMLPAMTYIGTRPALNPGSRVIETHIFDFDADIYGENLVTEFVQRLRPDANFDSIDALVAQMKRDELQAREILVRSRGELAPPEV